MNKLLAIITRLPLTALLNPAAVYALEPANVFWSGDLDPAAPTNWTGRTTPSIEVDGAGSLTVTTGGAVSSPTKTVRPVNSRSAHTEPVR